jgi:hypothetical protein
VEAYLDSFEWIVAACLERQGFWTMTSVTVNLSKAEKRRIGLPTSPRWELDVVAYRAANNELLVMECKSFLDSIGVRCATFEGKNSRDAKRYKLFLNPSIRRVVLRRLALDFVKDKRCRPKPKVTLGLAAGKLFGDERRLRALFDRKGWRLIGPGELADDLAGLPQAGYQNDVASLVAKLLDQRATPSSRSRRAVASTRFTSRARKTQSGGFFGARPSSTP